MSLEAKEDETRNSNLDSGAQDVNKARISVVNNAKNSIEDWFDFNEATEGQYSRIGASLGSVQLRRESDRGKLPKLPKKTYLFASP